MTDQEYLEKRLYLLENFILETLNAPFTTQPPDGQDHMNHCREIWLDRVRELEGLRGVEK